MPPPPDAEARAGWRYSPRSLRARLTIWYTAVLATLVVGFAAIALVVIDRVISRRTDQFLLESERSFRAELESERAEEPTTMAAIHAAIGDFRFRDVLIVVYRDEAGKASFLGATATTRPASEPGHESEGPLPLDLGHLAVAVSGAPDGAIAHERFLTLPDAEGGYRIVARPHRFVEIPLVIVVAQPLYDQREALDDVGFAFLIAVPAFLTLAALAGIFLASRGLAPLGAMSRRAAAIGATNLQDRVPVSNPDDELGRLGVVINQLLDRLQHTFEQQRQFMADASHELRTPVTILRNEAEIALARVDRTPEELRDSLAVVSGEGTRLSRIVNDLFLLARADAGHQPLRMVDLYLDELALDVARAVRTIADRRHVTVHVVADSEMPLRGDEELLTRLVLNLVDNAIRHAPAESRVEVELQPLAGLYQLTVRNQGESIPRDAWPHLFDRFYRLDRARSRAGPDGGAGLGLAIVRWVAEAHGGTVALAESSPEQGTVFAVSLPIL